MSTIVNSTATQANTRLPRNSCLFAQYVWQELTSLSTPWLSDSDREELKEAQKRYWSDDYDGEECSEPGIHPFEPTEVQDTALDRLQDSICDKLISNYVPESVTTVPTMLGSATSKEQDELILTSFRQKIADRNVKELATMVLQGRVQILEGTPPRYPVSHSWFLWLLRRCVPEFDRLPSREVPYCPEQEDDEIYNAIVFRWEYMMLTDDITAKLGLPRPGGVSSALWVRDDCLPRSSAFDEAMAGYRSVLRKAKCCLYPSGCQLSIPEPLNPLRYLCAALALAKLSEEEGHKKVEEIIEIFGKMKQACLEAVLGDEVVRKCAEEWFSSIGRQIEPWKESSA